MQQYNTLQSIIIFSREKIGVNITTIEINKEEL